METPNLEQRVLAPSIPQALHVDCLGWMIHSTEHYFSPGMSVPQCPLLHGHDGKPPTRPTPGDVSQPNNTHLSQTRGCHGDGMRDEQGSLRHQLESEKRTLGENLFPFE